MSKGNIVIEFRRYDPNPETGQMDGTKIAEMRWAPDPRLLMRVLTVDGELVTAPTLEELADKLLDRYGKEKG